MSLPDGRSLGARTFWSASSAMLRSSEHELVSCKPAAGPCGFRL
ncbi:MAG: hypothetical protein OXG81_07500 [Acidobacteria bacterium]|nr:hypothetical protein [Acidobacteriota bacterium]